MQNSLSLLLFVVESGTCGRVRPGFVISLLWNWEMPWILLKLYYISLDGVV